MFTARNVDILIDGVRNSKEESYASLWTPSKVGTWVKLLKPLSFNFLICKINYLDNKVTDFQTVCCDLWSGEILPSFGAWRRL